METNRHNVTKERIDVSEEKVKGRLIEVRVLSFPFNLFVISLLWDNYELRRLASTDSNSNNFIYSQSGFPLSVYVFMRTIYFRKDNFINFLNMKGIPMSKSFPHN